MLSSIIPDRAHAGGSEMLLERLKSKAFRERLKREFKDLEWDLRMISYCKTEKNRKNEGKFISEIAESENKHPVDVICDLLIDENLEVSMINFYGCEEDVKYVMRNHLQMFCTDGLLPGKPHPRVYGTYPRVLGRYVRGMSVLRLEEAIRKMTSLPAQRIGLTDRGIIREGMYADIVIFDPERVIDKATYEDPLKFPEGVTYTIVNGVIVNERGKHTGKLPGKVLRKTGYM